MTPSSEQRDAIFKTFGRAFFKQDLDLMYEAVTPDFTWTVDDGDKVHVLDSREKIADFFDYFNVFNRVVHISSRIIIAINCIANFFRRITALKDSR